MIVVDFIDMDRSVQTATGSRRAFNDHLRRESIKGAVTRISELGLIRDDPQANAQSAFDTR